ncbi:ROK family protein [Lacisediminimonas sp.]|uniref:ROK family protein n=1 Tax=Lacisediminimonas sp. TaxID=3060582 RepID=UPI002717AB8A|nr:ROK family protein [Lacisediminimonas sp.]MDO8299752.1 ROK family protein [Lacisediminimonas sp.]
MEKGVIGGIDIGGTKVAVTVATAQGVLCRLSEPTCKTGAPEALPEQLIALLDAAMAQAGVPGVDAVGVSSCGPFARLDGRLALVTPNICGALSVADDLPNDWASIPLERVLRSRFSSMVICNDAVAALHAERIFGAVQDEPDCIYVTWSTGVGFGLCVDGNLLAGKSGNAGHAGHMLMSESSDALCGCGNRGDLEGMISGRNLARRLGRTTADIFNDAREGNAAAREIVMDAAHWLGRALYNLTATLDTRRIVIGGAVWEHHGDWLAPIVQQEISSRLPALSQGVQVLSAGLGRLVADIGALSLVMPPAWQAQWRTTRPWQEQLADPS